MPRKDRKQLLKKIGKLWEQHPDLRLGQLLVNVANIANIDDCQRDLFYLPDDEIENCIDYGFKLMKRWGGSHVSGKKFRPGNINRTGK